MVPVGSSGLCWPGGWLFPGCVCVCWWGGGGGGREGWIGACGLCPMSRARCMCAPRLPRFILQVNFSDTLLMVSILDMIAI